MAPISFLYSLLHNHLTFISSTVSVSVQTETKRNLIWNQGRSRKPSHPVVLIATTHLDLSSLTFPRLLYLGIFDWLYTAQNGLSRQFSPLFCLFACFYLQTRVCVCVCVTHRGQRVNLQGQPHHLRDPKMSPPPPRPHVHPHPPPSVSWPSCTACLSQGCTPACLRLPLHLGLSAALEEERVRVSCRYGGKSGTAYPRDLDRIETWAVQHIAKLLSLQ